MPQLEETLNLTTTASATTRLDIGRYQSIASAELVADTIGTAAVTLQWSIDGGNWYTFFFFDEQITLTSTRPAYTQIDTGGVPMIRLAVTTADTSASTDATVRLVTVEI